MIARLKIRSRSRVCRKYLPIHCIWINLKGDYLFDQLRPDAYFNSLLAVLDILPLAKSLDSSPSAESEKYISYRDYMYNSTVLLTYLNVVRFNVIVECTVMLYIYSSPDSLCVRSRRSNRYSC